MRSLRGGRSSQAFSWALSASLLAVAGVTAPACGGSSPASSAPGASPNTGEKAQGAAKKPEKGGPTGLVTMVTPSKLLPDLAGERGVVAYEDGHKRVLVDRMRLVAYEDGSLERAAELLPVGSVVAIALPTRLGGGYLFHAQTGGGTQLWRAPTWLGKLQPVVTLSSVASEIIPGFDRVYVRFASNNRLAALDPTSGEAMSLAPLPPAAAYGALLFADGWRAVIDTDLRGPLATFDAGSTWRPVGIRERVNAIPNIGGDPTILVQGGQYRIDSRGGVTFRAEASRSGGVAEDSELPSGRPPGPFGRRPLRAAVEDGWPDAPGTAVVARGGALGRVSLTDGAVLAVTEQAYADRQASCHAVRLGAGFGFVCGERDGATSIYAFEKPLAMREILRWKRPRFVSSSGNGALVIRGTCGDEAPVLADTRAYCILRADGKTREIRVKGEQLGFERIVALSDGREAVLVPPRAGSTGQLTILQGSSMTSVLLRLPAEPRSVAKELKNGMWLDGFEEREPGVLSGWVEAGGPIIGLRITLDGKVKAGDVRLDPGGAVLSGRFGLSVGEAGRAAETTDGGMTWNVFDLPERDEEDEPGSRARACGPVGCAIKGWIRVGWGKPAVADDLEPASSPPAFYLPMRASVALGLQCEVTGSVTPPPPPPVKGKPEPPPPRPSISFGTFGRRRETLPSWVPFRNTPPPALQADEVGVDNGAPYELITMRAYAWGKKGADWTRAGRWLIRFDDRFDPGGGVRSSSASVSPWSDEAMAADGLGTTSYGLTWSAALDPSGRAALVSACRSAICSLYAVSDGQPVLPLRDIAGRTTAFQKPFFGGAARMGETWFFITQGSAYDAVTLWRSDLGVSRQIATLFRPTQARYSPPEAPRLVRRALGGSLGILFGSAPDPGDRAGNFYVVPVDPESGEVSEAIRLTRRDLGGEVPERCAPGQDGWLVDASLDSTPAIELVGGYASLDSIELRMRIDPGFACVDSMAARMNGTFTKPTGAPPSSPPSAREADAGWLPLAVTERSSDRRWVFRCSKQGEPAAQAGEQRLGL
jgi:hypothetical protein